MSEELLREISTYATHITQAGSGRPVLWLHDSIGHRWTQGHEALSLHCSLTAPSLPGFVDSAALDGIDGPEDVVLWLLDLLDALTLDRPVMLGCGLGGWMAAEFAVRYPERLSRLVLVDAYGLQVNGALPADEFALTPPMLRPLLFSDPEGPIALEWLPNAPSPERMERTLHARVAAARLAWQFPYSTKLRGRLGRARVPALVLWGGRDGLVPVAHAYAYEKELPTAQVVVIDGAGHYPYIEEPDRFAEEVARFIG